MLDVHLRTPMPPGCLPPQHPTLLVILPDSRQVGYGILLNIKFFGGRLPPPRPCPRAPHPMTGRMRAHTTHRSQEPPSPALITAKDILNQLWGVGGRFSVASEHRYIKKIYFRIISNSFFLICLCSFANTNALGCLPPQHPPLLVVLPEISTMQLMVFYLT